MKIPVAPVAVVGSTAPDIGAYARRFAAIHQTRNPAEMRTAGTAVAQELLLGRPATSD